MSAARAGAWAPHEPVDVGPAALGANVMDALPAAVYTTDAEGRVTSFNKACVTFSGRIPELNTDRWCVTWKLFWPDGRYMPFDECPMAVALRDGVDLHGAEAIAERPDGSRIWFAAHPTPLYDDDGGLIGGVNMLVDITARKASELSLARSAREKAALYHFTDRLQRAGTAEEIHDAALDAILHGLASDRAAILLLDGEGVMRFVAHRGLSDAYRAAVEGHSPWSVDDGNPQVVVIPEAASSDLDAAVRAVIAREGISGIGFIPLVSAGRLTGKFMVYYDQPHDFTEAEQDLALAIARQLAFAMDRQQAEAGRRETSAALVEADRRKDEFLATLAHELRNPLGPLYSVLPLIERSVAAGESPKRWVEMAERQTARLTRLVDDLMDVARITRGHIELRREPVDMFSLVQRAIDAHIEDAEAHGLTVERPPASPPLMVDGDPMRLEQVVSNLLSNAVKYTDPGGTIAIAASARGDYVELTVRDTGIGVEADFRPRMFTLFEQADRTLDRSKGGLGVGLTLAQQLVELHGGSIRGDSPGAGKGTTFTIRLPASQRYNEPAHENRTSATRSGVRVEARRVLVVDDNTDYADVLSEYVGQLGHVVAVAYDGQTALEAATAEPPDVVLLDIGLPGLSGYELAERLRGNPATGRALIVAISGYSQAADRELSAHAGFDQHIVKPINLDVLRDLIAGAERRPGDPPA